MLKQSYGDFELLVIDDGSSDHTERCVANYNDTRIRYIKHERNLGQNSALNTGLDLARGGFVSFLDSDDEWLPGMLEKVFEKFNSDADIDCVYTAWGAKLPSGVIQAPMGNSLEGCIYREALERVNVCPPTTLSVRRKCFGVVGHFELDVIVCQDDVMCLKLAKAFKFGWVKEVLATMHYDAGGRLTDDPVLTAYGYYYLYNKFADDIVKYCGRKTMAKHYARSGMLFLNVRESNMAFKAFCKSLTRGFSAKAIGYMAFLLLPYSYQRKLRSTRQSMIHAWRSFGHPHG